MPIDYGRLVSRTWELFSSYRVLWALGMVATLLTGWVSMIAIGAWLLIFSAFMFGAMVAGLGNGETPGDMTGMAQVAQTLWDQWAGVALALACVLAVLSLGLSLVSAGGEAALITAVDHTAQTGERLPFRAAWRRGWLAAPLIWMLNLLIGMLVGALLLGFLGVMGGAMWGFITNPQDASAMRTMTTMSTCLSALSILSWPVFIAIMATREFTVRAIVIERQPLGRALGTGLGLLRHNIVPVLAMLLILFVVGMIQGVVLDIILIPGFLVGFFVPLLGLSSGTPANIPAWSFLLEGCVGIGLGVALVVITGPFSAFTSALWTMLYRNRRGLPHSELTLAPAIPVVPPSGGPAYAVPYTISPPAPYGSSSSPSPAAPGDPPRGPTGQGYY